MQIATCEVALSRAWISLDHLLVRRVMLETQWSAKPESVEVEVQNLHLQKMTYE